MQIKPGATIGIVGGGQLGRMMALAAFSLGYRVHVFTDTKDSPAALCASMVTVAPYEDMEACRVFATQVDVITYEFENIPSSTLLTLERNHLCVRPNHTTLLTAQDRLAEKALAVSLAIPVPVYTSVGGYGELLNGLLPGKEYILKTTRLGYDGKGQYLITPTTNLVVLWKKARTHFPRLELMIEEKVAFTAEISVILSRDSEGNHTFFPIGQNKHEGGILRTAEIPATLVAPEVKEKAMHYTLALAEHLAVVGTLAVEYFVIDKEVMFNEMAPRPHNSGHWTIEGCMTSQFEQHIRAICGLPLGSVTLRSEKITLQNLIGEEVQEWQTYLANPCAKLHLYGKTEVRSDRKMGHVNYLSNTTLIV